MNYVYWCRQLAVIAAALTIASGCGGGKARELSAEEAEYTTQLDRIATNVQTTSLDTSRELIVVMKDKALFKEEKTTKMADLLNNAIVTYEREGESLGKMKAPSYLAPVHKFYLSEIEGLKGTHERFRDALRAGVNEDTKKALDEMIAYPKLLKDQKVEAWNQAGLPTNYGTVSEAAKHKS